MIGFAGASRTGKSTLAKLVSERTTIPFHSFNTAQIMKERGFNLVDPATTFETRLDAQDAYLDHYAEMMAALPRPVLTDRTPLCLAGYLLAEIRMHDHAEHGERVRAFAERAIRMTEDSFALVIIPRPLPFYEEAEGKAPANLGYQFHHQVVVEGLADHCRRVAVGRLGTSDLEERAEAVINTIVKRLEKVTIPPSLCH